VLRSATGWLKEFDHVAGRIEEEDLRAAGLPNSLIWRNADIPARMANGTTATNRAFKTHLTFSRPSCNGSLRRELEGLFWRHSALRCPTECNDGTFRTGLSPLDL
jgi:hypothetical protein